MPTSLERNCIELLQLSKCYDSPLKYVFGCRPKHTHFLILQGTRAIPKYPQCTLPPFHSSHCHDLQNCAIMSYLPIMMAEGGLMMVLQNERIHVLMWIMPRENDDLIQKYEFHNGSTQAIYGYLEKHDFLTKQKHLSILCKNKQRSRNISTFRKHA